MSESFPREFERLCEAVLASAGYVVHLSGGLEIRVDMIINRAHSERRAVEVKWSPHRVIALNDLQRWAGQLVGQIFPARDTFAGAILMVSGDVGPSDRAWILAKFDVEVWDRSLILENAKNADVSERLRKFFERSDASLKAATSREQSSTSSMLLNDDVQDMPKPEQGAGLMNELTKVPKGKKGAKQYERICQQIVAYLFGDSLLDPKPQAATRDSFNQFDIVYRIDTTAPFWNALTRDFRSRVLLVECKNYSSPIKGMQVFTTERYLSKNALRSVCLMLCRSTPSKSAQEAALGALRDSGKLIVMLSDDDVRQMLLAKDSQLHNSTKGGGPEVVLDQKIFEFLAQMPR